jgi:hypothetical protein
MLRSIIAGLIVAAAIWGIIRALTAETLATPSKGWWPGQEAERFKPSWYIRALIVFLLIGVIVQVLYSPRGFHWKWLHRSRFYPEPPPAEAPRTNNRSLDFARDDNCGEGGRDAHPTAGGTPALQKRGPFGPSRPRNCASWRLQLASNLQTNGDCHHFRSAATSAANGLQRNPQFCL